MHRRAKAVCNNFVEGREHSGLNKYVMRKLILQVQMSLDGFVAGPEGELDWIFATGPDEALFERVIELAASCDTILLGRKMTRSFVDHWENVLDNMPHSNEQPLAKLMVGMRKIAFSHTQTEIGGRNLEVENGDLATAVQALKEAPGRDIIVYGGAGFVSSLIALNLVDEYHVVRSPVAIGKGMAVFHQQKILKLQSSTAYPTGKTWNVYLPV
jgi:dihydrofolate reductase